jgi:hypothetical protein
VRSTGIFSNPSTTEPNGVSELRLAPHRATVLTTSLGTLRLKEGSGSPKPSRRSPTHFRSPTPARSG